MSNDTTNHTEFTDSPDAGQPKCLCSKCGNKITSRELPLRLFDKEKNTEFRYCQKCGKECFGIDMGLSEDDFDF